MNKANTEKRLRITRALQRNPIALDEPFVELMEHLARRDRNLNAVLQHINSYSAHYRTSVWGEQQIHKQEIANTIGKWNNPIYPTFTPRYELNSDALKSRYVAFINTISKSIYKNAYKRHSKRIKHQSYVEGNNINTRTHIHSVIEVPDGRGITEIKSLIQKCWANTGRVYFGDGEKYTTGSTAGYLTKRRTKCGDNGMSLQDSFIP